MSPKLASCYCLAFLAISPALASQKDFSGPPFMAKEMFDNIDKRGGAGKLNTAISE